MSPSPNSNTSSIATTNTNNLNTTTNNSNINNNIQSSVNISIPIRSKLDASTNNENNNNNHQTPSIPYSTTNSSSYRQNIRDLKAIDSVDSVSGLLTTSESKNNLKQIFNNNKNSNNITNKFSNIDENEIVNNSNELIEKPISISTSNNFSINNNNNNDKNIKLDYLNDIKNDNDNIYNLNQQQSLQQYHRRSPITPIIRHYNDKSPNNQQPQLHTSSISIKLETHSPTHLKSFNNYTTLNTTEYDSSNFKNTQQSNSSNQSPSKFNGKF
jgi:CCR4-NOT transcription complex subunit 7/8